MPRDKDKDTRAKRGGEKANTGEQRVGLGCCSEGEGGGEGGEPPVMKSAIRIPSSNLQPNLYISRYTLV